MKKITLALLFLVFLPAVLFARQADQDDPFKRDPIFTKPIEELIGISEPEEEDPWHRDDSQDFDRAVRHLSVTGLDLGGSFEAGPYYSNALYSQYPNLPMFHFNRVNGLFIGLRKERMQWHRYSSFLEIPQIQPHGFIGWGTASKRWEYAVGLEKLIGENNRFIIGAEYHKASGTEDFKRAGLVESTFTSFFAGYDYLDYQMMEGFGLYTVYRTQRWLEAAFSYNRSEFSSLEQKTGYTMFGYSSTYRPNPPVDALSDEINLDVYGLSLSLNPRNVLITNRFTASGTVIAELADNGASDEEYRFNRYRTELKLFYNFEPGSVLRWRIHAGGITGNTPDFKDFYLGGIGTLRGSPYKFFQGNQMLASNLEVQFGRPSQRAGEWIRDYNLHLLLFLDSGWAREIPELITSSNPFSGLNHFSFTNLQHDAGVGIGTGALRFELAWPLRTFDSSPVFWVRLNPTF
ncbi:MAG: BamA/TamA family outer membrane protein [Balneolaceae bacterium]|nr:BamA/TamA family outer membrane protein [Balneolaceae bacterium]